MTHSEKPKKTPASESEDQTYDVRDLVSKGGYAKNPREIIENPAVTPQMVDESSDSQVGFETSNDDE